MLNPLLRGVGVCEIHKHGVFVDVYHTPHTSVVQSTELPSLSTDRHLVYPLKASFALSQEGRISFQNSFLKLLYPDMAIRLTASLVVIILMILFAFPELFCRTENGIHLMTHGTE